jgi:hypothetical protein
MVAVLGDMLARHITPRRHLGASRQRDHQDDPIHEETLLRLRIASQYTGDAAIPDIWSSAKAATSWANCVPHAEWATSFKQATSGSLLLS